MTINYPNHAINILIVDDTPANVLLLVRMLNMRGYNTRSVLSGKLALQAAHAEIPDLILLDITMPDMNGFEVCTQLKNDEKLKDIPVIFISALNDTVDKVKAFRVGGVDYVTKPFQFEEVYARIQTHVHLRRLEKLRDDLAHMVIHDLHNPLSVINGFLHHLETQESQHLSKSTNEYIALARLSADELRYMISAILDVSKLASGEMSLKREDFDLYALIRSVIASTHPLPGNRTITLLESASYFIIKADQGLLRRIIQNLVGNALRYTPAKGDVRIIITPFANEVRITVTDIGPGIAPEFHRRIFEKFGQVTEHDQQLGTGLGLYFCKLAVEAHGGRIGVDSEVGSGSTFWMVLPNHISSSHHVPQE